MKKLALAIGTALLSGAVLTACSMQQSANSGKQAINIDYPATAKKEVVDTYFGTKVSDPYRWLEDDMSTETADWVKRQNKTTFGYLEQIPYREQIEKKLAKLMDYEKVGMPFVEGNYTYFYKNDGLQNQYVLYRKNKQGETEVFLDPNKFSKDGTVSLSSIEFTEDGSKAVYLISEGGSDWRKARIIDTETKEVIEPELVDIKFSGLSWLNNEGFYYSSYDKPKGSELSAKTDQHKLYYHKLGTPQSTDTLVFGGTPAEKHRYVYGGVTDDKKYLIISASVSTSGNKVFIKEIGKKNAPLVAIVDNTDSDTNYIGSKGEYIYFETNLDAPNKRVVRVKASNPAIENWQTVIPETDNVLNVSTGGGYIFASYIKDATSMIQQFDFDGNKVRDIELPEVGTAGGFYGKKKQKQIYYSFSNQKTPSTIFELDVTNGSSEVYSKSKVKFDSDNFVSKQVFYKSKDGTKVPMIITHKKGIELDGSNPTILYGYGGFNISLLPRFSSTRAAWLELGGIYAVANLRGGGEYGKKWHVAGTQLQKQNVFDDFIAAAEYLTDAGYTSNEKLAVMGGSNGGLLVGAVMTQRPELFQVALPAVGVLDMLRYHTFTAGAGWAYDYGTAEDNKEMFEYLLGYSPVHNVKSGVDYPATMITTGDHDDRVVPAHSFKFAAELQAKHTGDNPTLIRIETDAGHGAGTPTSKIIEQYADIFGFTLYNMGVESIN